MGPTRTLAEWIAGLRYDALPERVVEQACHIITDTLGCCLSAFGEDKEKCRVATGLAKLYVDARGATVIRARGLRARPAFAALANGILANAADNDDTHKRALLHTGSVVVLSKRLDSIQVALGEGVHSVRCGCRLFLQFFPKRCRKADRNCVRQ